MFARGAYRFAVLGGVESNPLRLQILLQPFNHACRDYRDRLDAASAHDEIWSQVVVVHLCAQLKRLARPGLHIGQQGRASARGAIRAPVSHRSACLRSPQRDLATATAAVCSRKIAAALMTQLCRHLELQYSQQPALLRSAPRRAASQKLGRLHDASDGSSGCASNATMRRCDPLCRPPHGSQLSLSEARPARLWRLQIT